jgi:hypothetical protein
LLRYLKKIFYNSVAELRIEETLAPEVMQDIAEWINRLH